MDFIEYLESKKIETQKLLNASLAKFNNDIFNRFAWDGESIYKGEATIRLLNELLASATFLKNENKPIDLVLIRERLTERVMRTVLMDRSTSQLHCLCSLWEKEVIVKFLDELKWESFMYTI